MLYILNQVLPLPVTICVLINSYNQTICDEGIHIIQPIDISFANLAIGLTVH
jgi:hypothetical protein